MTDRVRVRFAPSPTGEPHVGNIRTALFDWLYARHTGGTFILRIEDTDQARIVPGALEAILEGLRWLGLDWQEGPEVGGPFAPYVQSERAALGIYQRYSQQLIESGWAYECYCSPERLDEVRREQQRQKLPPMYDRWCRDPHRRDQMAAQNPGKRPVVRFAIPLEGDSRVTFADFVRGEITFATSTLDDFVLLKSDGYPTYHLANVVDDHLMEISHVVRGDEWLSSTPRHVLLYRAFGWEGQMPVFVHLPLILGSDKAKLSKRHGATSALAYKEMGYLPEAMVNFLSLLGWSLDDSTELFTREELVRHISLERISPSPAVFNGEKLLWMNGVYIRGLSLEELADRLMPFLAPALGERVLSPNGRQYLLRILPLIQERLKRLDEGPDLVSFFFDEDLSYDPSALAPKGGLAREDVRRALDVSLQRLRGVDPFDAPTLEGVLRPLAAELEVKVGQLFGALRVAVTGRSVAPPLFQTMEVLGQERCLRRVERAIALLS